MFTEKNQPIAFRVRDSYGPLTLAIFAVFFLFLLRFQAQFCRVINYWRFRGDLNHQSFTRRRKIALEIAAKIARIKGPLQSASVGEALIMLTEM